MKEKILEWINKLSMAVFTGEVANEFKITKKQAHDYLVELLKEEKINRVGAKSWTKLKS